MGSQGAAGAGDMSGNGVSIGATSIGDVIQGAGAIGIIQGGRSGCSAAGGSCEAMHITWQPCSGSTLKAP